MSIKESIIRFIEDNGPKFGGQIEDHIRSVAGAKSSNASRRCRELVNDGILERELVKIEGVENKVVMYKLNTMQKPENPMHWRPEVLKQKLFEESQKQLL